MKKKHYGPVIVIIIILVFFATVVCGMISTNSAKKKIHYKSLGPLPEITAPDSINLEKINRLIKEMPDLLESKQEPGAIVSSDLSLFSNFQSVTAAGEDKNTTSDYIGYNLSFVFVSDSKKFCVINGRFYSEGNTLPDGTLIDRVESERVRISKNKLKKWLAVTGPRGESKGKQL
jgi:hypothetical protein